ASSRISAPTSPVESTCRRPNSGRAVRPASRSAWMCGVTHDEEKRAHRPARSGGTAALRAPPIPARASAMAQRAATAQKSSDIRSSDSSCRPTRSAAAVRRDEPGGKAATSRGKAAGAATAAKYACAPSSIPTASRYRYARSWIMAQPFALQQRPMQGDLDIVDPLIEEYLLRIAGSPDPVEAEMRRY